MLGNYRGSVLSWPVALASSSLSSPDSGWAPGPPVSTMCNHLHKPCRPPVPRGPSWETFPILFNQHYPDLFMHFPNQKRIYIYTDGKSFGLITATHWAVKTHTEQLICLCCHITNGSAAVTCRGEEQRHTLPSDLWLWIIFISLCHREQLLSH